MGELPEGLVVPHPDRLDPDHAAYARILAAHEHAIDAGQDGYVDPASGYLVFTAGYLWDRGYCCENGCRHCPYLDQDERL